MRTKKLTKAERKRFDHNIAEWLKHSQDPKLARQVALLTDEQKDLIRLVFKEPESECKQEDTLLLTIGPLAEPVSCEPPLKALFLLYFFLPKKNRDALLGDLEQEHKEVHARFGKRLAGIWFWKQVFTSVWPLVSGWFKTPFMSLSKWVQGTVAETIKRKMG